MPRRATASATARRVGVLGGTFDPLHIGHVALATEARHALALDRVLLVVANDPWQKTDRQPVTPAEDRWAVVAAGVGDIDGLEASRLEIDRGGPSYTVDTLAELRAQQPGGELFLIVGADVVGTLPTWHRADDLPGLATLVIATRAGWPAPPDPPGWRVVHLEVPALDVSSSDVRRRLAEGRPVAALVPPAAMRCIERRGLYARGRCS